MKDASNYEKFRERESCTPLVLHPVKKCENCKKMRNEHNFEAKFFLELGSYMYVLKSHTKFVAKWSGTKTTINSKKKHQKPLLAMVMRQKMHFY